MNVIGLDIETGGLDLPFDETKVKFGNIKDPEKKEMKIIREKIKWQERQALDSKTGEILLVCIGRNEKYNDYYGDEYEILEHTWAVLDHALGRGHKIVGHNIFGFDLPFLIRRSYLYGVKIPHTIYNHQFRRWNEGFADTMKLWALTDFQCFISLNDLDQFLGGPGVPSGKGFREEWEKDQLAAIDYCHGDVEAVLRCANKMGVESL